MRWILFLAMGIGLWGAPLRASVPSSYRLPHPVGWMHMLPVGEVPGWQNDFWFQFDAGHSNVWNAPIEMQNIKDGTTYSYNADWAQTYGLLEVGAALTDRVALGIEVPYSHRGGGFLDQTIDSFHVMIGSDRFSRPDYPKNETSFAIGTNGTNYFEEYSYSGTGQIKAKIKFWWWKWLSAAEEICPCGLSTSVQVKSPVDRAKQAFTTGDHDYSALVHFGVPLFSQSALWVTSAVTKLGDNPALAEWPRRKWHQMYELSLDLAIDQKWGFIFQVRAESPILNGENLAIVAEAETDEEQLIERISSGWNSLVHWRGSEAFGFRYRPGAESQANFLVVEDWGVGPFDERGDRLYVNNAPDVVFLLQYAQSF